MVGPNYIVFEFSYGLKCTVFLCSAGLSTSPMSLALRDARANADTQPVASSRHVEPPHSGAILSELELWLVVEKSLLKDVWSGWMDQRMHHWRVANVQFVAGWPRATSGVYRLQTPENENPRYARGNIIRHVNEIDKIIIRFSLYLREGDRTMKDLEGNFEDHPYVRTPTMAWRNAKRVVNAKRVLSFETRDGHSIHAGLTCHGCGKDDCGMQMTRVFIEFRPRSVLDLNFQGRMCDMLLNVCGYFSWFEMGQIRKVNSTSDLPLVAPSPPSSGSLWRHPIQARLTVCGLWERCEALLAACVGACKWFCEQPVAHP